MKEASSIPWETLAWGMGLLVSGVVLYYLASAGAWYFIYHSAATRSPGRARFVRAVFRGMAAEVDDHRAKVDPEVLARSDARIVEHTKIYGKKALGCAVWLLLLALTIVVVGRL